MPNHLQGQQSLYLLQHANNPVDWYPWCDEAFERAKKENKPVIVSIGYAACHWCHVMEHESFEDKETAAYMNEHFINIKVDREEHPGVDHFYMDAVQALTGAGGWPLNVFATPGRMPFYGGTYFPPRPAYNRPSWRQLLERMQEVWHKEGNEVASQTEQMQNYMRQTGAAPGIAGNFVRDESIMKSMAEALLKQADVTFGGFGPAPKFPATHSIRFLLEQDSYFGNERAKQQALLSLDKMMEGGIYDQLAGGFARYSTDAQWLAPHFEKMLYDNALLLNTLCDAWQATENAKYKHCIDETIAFCNRELRHPSGGYYSALDADSEGVEGKFYTWEYADWKAAISNLAHEGLLAQHYGVVPEGNWEHTNILHQAVPLQKLAVDNQIPIEELAAALNTAKERLLVIRSGRVRPQTDDKCLLSWNALMNVALCRCACALGNSTYLELAVTHMQWMQNAYQHEIGWLHSWKDGIATIPAHLDDLAYLMDGLIQLGSATGNAAHFVSARKLMDVAIANFSEEESGFFFFTSSKQTDLPLRKVEIYDGATPSANAVMANNLWRLGLLYEDVIMMERADLMLQRMSGNTQRHTGSFALWAILLQRTLIGLKTVLLQSVDTQEFLEPVRAAWLPEIVIVDATAGRKNDLPMAMQKLQEQTQHASILVCSGQSCLAPQKNFKEFINLLRPIIKTI